MNTKIEILSKEMIKPSTQTPHTLSDYKFSLLDNIAPTNYFPLLFFYQPENKYEFKYTKISQKLKESLSNTLTIYYPISGRFNGKFSFTCNDAGVEYIEARVHAQLAQVIDEPSMEELRKFLPKQPHLEEVDVPVAIQVNFFDCGGIAICACISHILADASSLSMFMDAWAAIFRGEHDKVMKPLFDAATHFPPKDVSHVASPQDTGENQNDFAGVTQKEKMMTKRFVFDKEKLASLKEKAKSSSVKDPTRVECVTAYIWKHFMDGKFYNNMKSFAVSHAVNLRSGKTHGLPKQTYGNLWDNVYTLLTPEKEDKSFQNLVSKLRHAIRSSNIEKIKNQRDEYVNSVDKFFELYGNEDVEVFMFSSWCGFPLYELDYGWGKPVWVCTATLPYKNLIILMSTKCGEGIEAWVNMVDDDLTMLQSDLMITNSQCSKAI